MSLRENLKPRKFYIEGLHWVAILTFCGSITEWGLLQAL